MAQQQGVGEFKTQAPDYDKATKLFTQRIEFRSYTRIPANQAGHVVEEASKLFKLSLGLNKLDDYAWPPEHVECHGHADAKGMLITLGTRADVRKQVVLH